MPPATLLHPAHPSNSIPANAAVCLHPEYIDEILLLQPDVDWFEIHAARYLNDAMQQRSLSFLRQAYRLAIHISQVSANATTEEAAAALAPVVDFCKPLTPGLVSVDLWAGPTGTPDRVPAPPCTRSLLDTAVDRVDQIQIALNQIVAVSHFPVHSHRSQMQVGEGVFYSELVRRTGCTVLVDLSAILQSAAACNDHPVERLDGLLSAIPHSAISEFHLAGTPITAYHRDRRGLTSEQWTLFTHAARTTGARPCVANHKTPLPDLQTLLGEATLLDVLMGLRIPEEDRTSFDVE